MASKAKRPRKVCPNCNDEFSARHALRHIAECRHDLNRGSYGNDTVSFSNTSQYTVDDEISDNEQEVSYHRFHLKKKQLTRCNNLEEEDINCHFDCVLDSDTEEADNFDIGFSDFDSSDDEIVQASVPSNTENNLVSDTFWFCRILLLWQCINCISDKAISFLLQLFSCFLKLLAKKSEMVEHVYSVFPRNLHSMTKFMKHNVETFTRFVVCIKCYSLYKYEDCLRIVEGTKMSKTCTHVEFPNHRLTHLRRPCNQQLLNSFAVGANEKLIPFKTFCFSSLKESLQRFVNRPGFEDLCENWRKQERNQNVMCDIYDGKIWEEFNGSKHNFFTEENNYGVMLNVDWFQPYKYTNYSVGVLYLAICNLPRDVRFKRENIILVGIIPDMKSEPKTDTFLYPLVKELKEAWSNGYLIYSHKSPQQPKTFKLALICVGCDIPASRKLCGFLGHSATMGCNKCKKQFPGGIGEKNYGGFDRTLWVNRTNFQHRNECERIKRCTTKSERQQLESKFGTRYSCLLELSYFDPVRMTPIDPMHNLFLGTAKHIISVWKSKKIISEDQCKIIERRMENYNCPTDVGKLPQKFATSFGSFNADQLKNWTVLFSIYCLNGILPENHLKCWRKFVLACRRMCSRYLTVDSAKIADRLMLQFCEMFQQLYGEECVTPNMHLHGHLYDCLIDYGPVYSFWLFSFERQNGILGSYKTNKKKIEVQLMKHFLKESWAREEREGIYKLSKELQPFFNSLRETSDDRGTLGEVTRIAKPSNILKSTRNFVIHDDVWDESDGIMMPKLKPNALNDDELNILYDFYKSFCPENVVVCSSVQEGKELYVNGSILGSKHSRSVRSSYVMAFWADDDGKISDVSSQDLTPKPGQIESFLKHCILVNGKTKSYYLAKVRWFKRLPDTLRYHYGNPLEVWASNLYVQRGPATYIPIHRIKCRFVFVATILDNKDVMVISPREQYIL